MKPAAILLCLLALAACHRGEDHPLYEWEMIVPYSENVGPNGYPIMGPVSRYDSLADCQKDRTNRIRGHRDWIKWLHTQPDPVPASNYFYLELLRSETWCLPSWPDTETFTERTTAGHGPNTVPTSGLKLGTPATVAWLRAWYVKGGGKIETASTPQSGWKIERTK